MTCLSCCDFRHCICFFNKFNGNGVNQLADTISLSFTVSIIFQVAFDLNDDERCQLENMVTEYGRF